VVAGVALIVTHFGTFKRIVGGVWKWFTGAVGTAAGALKGVFEAPIKWLINAIKWIVDKVLWLPRELAKLNPFGGGPADTAHGRATIAHHAHSMGLATGVGPAGSELGRVGWCNVEQFEHGAARGSYADQCQQGHRDPRALSSWWKDRRLRSHTSEPARSRTRVTRASVMGTVYTRGTVKPADEVDEAG